LYFDVINLREFEQSIEIWLRGKCAFQMSRESLSQTFSQVRSQFERRISSITNDVDNEQHLTKDELDKGSNDIEKSIARGRAVLVDVEAHLSLFSEFIYHQNHPKLAHTLPLHLAEENALNTNKKLNDIINKKSLDESFERAQAIDDGGPPPLMTSKNNIRLQSNLENDPVLLKHECSNNALGNNVSKWVPVLNLTAFFASHSHKCIQNSKAGHFERAL